LAALFIAVAPLTSVAQAQSARDGAGGSAPSAGLLVTGLQELQGSTVGPGGALYVTAPLTGSIWRVDPQTGAVTLFADGLPARFPGLDYIGSGVVDVAFIGGTAYALVTGVGPDLGGHDVVGIYRVDGPHSSTIVADIGAWSTAHPPATDFVVPTGFQFAIQAFHGGLLVTDGHHNRVLWVTLAGQISQVIAFSDIVPTGLAVRGNTIYLAEAGPLPHLPETSKVMSFGLNSATATQVASGAGLNNIGLLVDVEFGGNTLYALAQGFWNGPFEGTPAQPNTGALVKVNPDGTFTVIVAGLNQPTSLEFIGNTGYVVNLAGEIWKIDNVFPPAHSTVKETINWTMPAGQCASVDGEVTGTGQRSETIDTLIKPDGSSQVVINDLVVGTAQGSDGQQYSFYYANHSIWTSPASGSPVAIKMDDLFLLQNSSGGASNRYVVKAAFVWRWTYDPNTAAYWPPVDNFVQTHTLGDPINCDPI
jgi:hypothetical protein